LRRIEPDSLRSDSRALTVGLVRPDIGWQSQNQQ
jgi:hypothetical protein